MSTETPQTEQTKQGVDNFDTIGLLLDFLNNWKWFVLCAVIGFALAYYKSSTIIPRYNVSASIYLNDDNSSRNSELLTGISQNRGFGSEFQPYLDQTEIEILKSKNNLIKIVDSLNLSYSYYEVGKLRDTPVYKTSPVIVTLDSLSLANLRNTITLTITQKGKNGYLVEAQSAFDKKKPVTYYDVPKLPAKLTLSQGTVTLTPSPVTSQMNAPERVVINHPSSSAAALAGSLRIEYAENSPAILRLSINTPIIPQGCDILKVLIEFYNRQILDDKNRSAMQTEAFILDRLGMISGELKDVEERLREYRQTHNIANIDQQTSINLSQKNAKADQLASVDAEGMILSELEKMVSQQDSYETLPTLTENAALSQSIAAYNVAVTRYKRAANTMTEETAHLQGLQDNLKTQKSQIISNISAAKRDNNVRRRSISMQENAAGGQLAMQPTIDKGLNEIFREQSVKVNIYTYLLQKREEIALQKTLATPTAQFIDNPTGSGPVSPKRMQMWMIGALIGLLVPALIIYLHRLLVPKFKDREELERLTNVPILGEICLKPKKETSHVVVGENISTPIAELFRLLRNNISFARTDNDKKVMLVTSAISGEGKTFVALNLAMTYALTGKKVCVVGLDIRRPVLARDCGLDNRTGVTTFLSGQQNDITELIHQTKFNPNLYVLPAGPVPPNPNELLMSDNAHRMFEQLRNNFDYVIVDSAPIDLVSDTFLLIGYTDLQIFVTRASYSTKKGLKMFHQCIDTNRMPNAYIVINGVNQLTSSYIYRRYGSYGYGYGYTYGGYGSHGRPHRRKWYHRLLGLKKRR